jgi:murein DD-endopeptidase MepM/ murein hydrolase activator NlpD
MLLLTAATGLAACARNGPPAPVVSRAGPAASATSSAAARPVAARLATAHPDRVTVQAGDTLYGIARRYDVPMRSIIEANKLQPPYGVTKGSTLVLPQVAEHVVQPGETLYTVSRQHGVDASSLARTNRLGPPYDVHAGEALVLPAPVQPTQTTILSPNAPPEMVARAGGAPVATTALPPPKPVPPELAPMRGGTTTGAAPAAPPTSPPVTAPVPLRPPAAVGAPAPVALTPQPPTPPVPADAKPPEARPAVAALPPPAESPPSAEPPPAARPREQEQLAALPPPPAKGGHGFVWPVRGRVLSGYGPGAGGTHNDGVNIAAPQGTAVIAAEAGVVAYAGNELRGYGYLVLIKHVDGLMTAYAHNQTLLVRRGETVKRGQTIARVGATGAVGEPQLHFEIRRGTRALDPSDYLPAAAANG